MVETDWLKKVGRKEGKKGGMKGGWEERSDREGKEGGQAISLKWLDMAVKGIIYVVH